MEEWRVIRPESASLDHSTIGVMTIRVCVAGATGWAGSVLVKTILASKEFTLTAVVSKNPQQLESSLRGVPARLISA
jgi:FlaA1/EpsC-like NDP-sugar epimerase